MGILGALAIAACAPQARVADAAPAPVTAAASDAASCAAQGGAIRPVCRMQRPMCVIAYSDAGKACRGDADCQGKCRAPEGAVPGREVTGICQADSDPCGCRADVENGIAKPGICVD